MADGAVLELQESRQQTLGIEHPKEGRIATEVGGIVELASTPLFPERLPRPKTIFGEEPLRDMRYKPTETVVTGDLYPSTTENENIRVISGLLVPPRTRYRMRQYPHLRSFTPMYSDEDQETIGAEEMTFEGIEGRFVPSFKGANLRDPSIREDEMYPNGLAIEGLVTRDLAERAVENSLKLQEYGIKAEIIWRVGLLNQFPNPEFKHGDKGIEKEFLTRDEFKAWLLKQYESRLQASGDKDAALAKARKYFTSEASDPVVISRATTVPFRLSDLYLPFQEPPNNPVLQAQEFVYMMNHMISHLNRDREEGKKITPLYVPHDARDLSLRAKDQPNVAEFFNTFADNLGTQIGKLHKHGGAHRMLHAGNILADGSFCDIDSIGWTNNTDDMRMDIENLLENFFVIGRSLESAGFMAKNTSLKFAKQFLGKYFQTRFTDEEVYRDDDARKYRDMLRKRWIPHPYKTVLRRLLLPSERKTTIFPVREFADKQGERVLWWNRVLAD